MIYLVALTAGVGAGLVGAVLGLGLFALAFEFLRELDRDALLNSRVALGAFVFPCAVLGFVAGLALVWRWRPAVAATTPWWKTLTIAMLAGAGGAKLMFLADVGGLTAPIFALAKETAILVWIATAVAALIAGVALTILTFDRAASRWARALRTLIAIAGAFILVLGGFVADKRFTNQYRGLGSHSREALVEIRMPPAMYRGENALRVVLRTSAGTTPSGDSYYWFPQGDHLVVRTRINMSERTRERVLLVSFDGRPDMTVPLRFPGNPRIMHEYGPWQPLGPDGTMAIRILTR
jgi:hypothetical protein